MRTMACVDKSGWPQGEWNDEPDKVQWQDEATGLVCLIVRSEHGGHLCGYVGVAEGHPLFGVDYNNTYRGYDIDVHGGLTFSDFCHEREDGFGICHVAEPGQPERVWWLGFDCAHCDDMSPGYRSTGQYRRLAYVRMHCESLAKQLAAITTVAA